MRPERIVDHALSGVLELVWPDGHTSRVPHAVLRASCRCGACQQQRRQGVAPAASATAAEADELRLVALRPVSDLGLNLVFNDGHGRGLYPWAFLHELGQTA